MHMYHNFFIHSSVDRLLGCFHVLAIAKSAAMILKGFLDEIKLEQKSPADGKEDIQLGKQQGVPSKVG